MDNGIVQVTISSPDRIVTGIQYNGVDNLLEVEDEEVNRGFKGASFKVVVQNEDQVEVHIASKFMGFYSYAIFEHLEEWPPFNLPQISLRGRSRQQANSCLCQMTGYRTEDNLGSRTACRSSGAGVDDKYQYSSENKDLKVHGVGFWQITPSGEFRSGGPVKQNLTSHVGPYCLAMFLSAHYAGEDLVLKLNPGEPWKKGLQMQRETKNWPYSFPASDDFPKSDQQGKVCGRLKVQDRYVSYESIPANGAYIGLAPTGDVGSWLRECKCYQFWTKADKDGNPIIDNIRSGAYNVYAWVPGFIGDYRYDLEINITEGCSIDVGDLISEPPRDGPTLCEIGIPDRSAAEFCIPDPDPNYINKLYVNHPDRYRQYGLWERYGDLYPDEDLVFTIGVSQYIKDWFFTQVNRKKKDGTYQATTWQIKFTLQDVDRTGTYKLLLALATAHLA
ncbi:Rhamnogalacturonate lyase family protein [Hibiscus syriacus]|uniref:Rhamnogalacturonate lyase family protein n=1 Tax=Hibiscus syriacus TaxID=106335 RepID=A0A6A2WII8_HIBSY|nr:Rhamnogalacturonate lyase family protein [Hibiscus syriacus]